MKRNYTKTLLVVNAIVMLLLIISTSDVFSTEVEACVGVSQPYTRVSQSSQFCFCKSRIVYPQTCIDDQNATGCSTIKCDD